MTKNLTKEDILHLGTLASLSLSEQEIEQYKKQLGETIDYIENLHELDTEKVIPTSQTTSLRDVFFDDGEKNERSLSTEEAVQNSSKSKDGYFVVKRIME
jgi:aspartyl-tRNA(Asn)/glutamyl-tRNA(Gln) amidotransferase subunit C